MILSILLIAHFMADFTLQTTALADRKREKFAYLVLHAAVYACTLGLVSFLFVDAQKVLLSLMITSLSHFLIDWAKASIDKKATGRTTSFALFVIDQALHISIIIMVYFVFHLSEHPNALYSACVRWNYFRKTVIVVFLFVIIWDPAAIFVQRFIALIFPENKGKKEKEKEMEKEKEKKDKEEKEEDLHVGNIIGKLERLIIATLVLVNQFSAIGFVLTAKSIARYKQLENKSFAERYLIGTLLSVSIAFITAIVLRCFI